MIDILSIEFRNYKCFSTYCGFGAIKPTNVILGKNNIGKSSILDPITMLCTGKYDGKIEIRVGTSIAENLAASAFPPNMNGGDVGGNHWEVAGKNLVGKRLKVRSVGAWAPSLDSYEDFPTERFLGLAGGARLVSSIPNPFSGWSVRKIAAERDIRPEGEQFGNLNMAPNGVGATNLIMNIINRSEMDSGLIQKQLCDELNSIVGPEIVIDNIVVQRNPTNEWEVYLDDHKNGRVALSACGSGLKTIILVLLELQVIPSILGGSQKIYIFEELENNLHPSLQRRLMNYVHSFACRTDSIVFMTTHSNVVIDLFSEDPNASLYSLVGDESGPTTISLDTFLARKSILSDLGVHASDVLQANALIWVEGPSDRVYLKRLIEIYGQGDLREGVHYQFLYYGGRLLAHYSASDSFESDFIALLRVNSNCALIMDSDKSSKQSRIGNTKARIASEIEQVGMFSWITGGREIENYIPNDVLRQYLNDNDLTDLERYQDIRVYLNGRAPGLGEKFERSKVEFARSVAPLLTKENTLTSLDLAEKMVKLVSTIRAWNRA